VVEVDELDAILLEETEVVLLVEVVVVEVDVLGCVLKERYPTPATMMMTTTIKTKTSRLIATEFPIRLALIRPLSPLR
jgi:hypothetical protein